MEIVSQSIHRGMWPACHSLPTRDGLARDRNTGCRPGDVVAGQAIALEKHGIARECSRRWLPKHFLYKSHDLANRDTRSCLLKTLKKSPSATAVTASAVLMSRHPPKLPPVVNVLLRLAVTPAEASRLTLTFAFRNAADGF